MNALPTGRYQPGEIVLVEMVVKSIIEGGAYYSLALPAPEAHQILFKVPQAMVLPVADQDSVDYHLGRLQRLLAERDAGGEK